MVPPSEPRSYYGRPLLKQPVWTLEIPAYFFVGGMSGASAGLALLSELRGNHELARRAWAISFGAISLSPALLISDLGKPSRFYNMLRMFKITSPMSVGSWILSGSGTATSLAALNAWTGAFPAAGRSAKLGAALLGLPLATYTAALISNTAVPAWHEARLTLPLVFAGGAAASAGAAAVAVTPARYAAPARRLAVGGVLMETGAAWLMEKRLGELGEPYREGAAGKLGTAAKALNLAGGALIAARARRDRVAAVAGGTVVMAAALCERWSIFRAGFQSAADPKYTVGPQRRRIEEGQARGAVKRAGVAAATP